MRCTVKEKIIKFSQILSPKVLMIFAGSKSVAITFRAFPPKFFFFLGGGGGVVFYVRVCVRFFFSLLLFCLLVVLFCS